ncbi:MAG: thiamine pyrophosphate-binding protein [Nitrososphaerota archaeon]|nr:thiamine pyrophosphate-binding protein [Nitrososphaerota archaeon]
MMPPNVGTDHGSEKDEPKPEPRYVSDILVDVMRMLEIEYVALNPGATLRGLHDSIVQYGKNRTPELILCCHEETATSIAVGYALAKRKPMAVMVHDIVGLQHATKAIFEAWIERVPILLVGGTGPLDVDNRRPWIDWIHTSMTNSELVRGYVKWYDQPEGLTGAIESLLRGYMVSNTDPYGPVYVCYDAHLQEKRMEQRRELPDSRRFAVAAPPVAHEDLITRVTENLLSAKNPVIISERVGRNPTAFANLLELSELLSIPVLDRGDCLNFPNSNVLNVTGAEKEILPNADLILAVDVVDLENSLAYNPSSQESISRLLIDKDTTKIINLGLSNYLLGSWSADYRRLFPVDIPVLADSAATMTRLISKCKASVSRDIRESFLQRRRLASGIHNRLSQTWNDEAKQLSENMPISTARIAQELLHVVQNEEWVVTHGSLSGWIKKLWPLSDPTRYYGEGLGTGCGLGTGLGVALAYVNSPKFCISIVRDGDLLYNPSGLWTAAKYKIPNLILVFNNRSYYQDEGHQLLMASVRSRDAHKAEIGTRIDEPAVDFSELSSSYGVSGIGPVTEPSHLKEALEEAVEFLKSERKPVLVDIVTQPR